MEHARKVILVPAENEASVNQQQQQHQHLLSMDLEKTVQTPGTPISRFDALMRDILQFDGFPDLNAKSNAY